jgi:cobalt/nickel transport protein
VTSRRLTTALLVLGVLALFAVPLLIDGGRSEFTGTDTLAAELVRADVPGYEPWFSSVFSPSSSEVESGLFALQAALGGGAVGARPAGAGPPGAPEMP